MKLIANLTLTLVLGFVGCTSRDNGIVEMLDDYDEPSTGSLDASPTGTVFGGPSTEPILKPFQGEWNFSDQTIDPPPTGARLSGGPSLRIVGHIIRFVAPPFESELRLCLVREHETGIVAEGWFHEDIHDPGDMQRVDAFLYRDGDNLRMRWRKRQSEEYSDDPVIGEPGVPSHEKASQMPWWDETYTPATGG